MADNRISIYRTVVYGLELHAMYGPNRSAWYRHYAGICCNMKAAVNYVSSARIRHSKCLYQDAVVLETVFDSRAWTGRK